MEKKKNFLPLIILIILLVIFKTSGRLDYLIALNLHNQGNTLRNQNKYELAEQKYAEAVKISPDYTPARDSLVSMYRVLLRDNYGAGNYQNAAYYGEKLIKYQVSDAFNYFLIANCYTELQDYEKALYYYKKCLSYRPNYSPAITNIEYVKSKMENMNLNTSINRVRVSERAPSQLYYLIKTDLSANVKTQTEYILDLIWQTNDGRVILKQLYQNNIPIKIIQSDEIAHSSWRVVNGKAVPTEIVIPVKYIDNLNNTNLAALERIHHLGVFMHEFGHSFARIIAPQSRNSMEEEMAITMIAFNISYIIITGNSPSLEQTEKYSMNCFAGLLFDNHKELPVYSGIGEKFRSSGIEMPYHRVYSNLPEMYEKLLSAGAITPVASLDKLLK